MSLCTTNATAVAMLAQATTLLLLALLLLTFRIEAQAKGLRPALWGQSPEPVDAQLFSKADSKQPLKQPPNTDNSPEIRICIPNQTLAPFYRIKGQNISGLTVAHINYLFNQPALSHWRLSYQPEPWQRCLLSIENNKVDMIVAGYSSERAKTTVFPDAMGFDLATSSFSYAKVCFVKHREAKWRWDGEQLHGLPGLTLGLEPGFILPKSIPNYLIAKPMPIWDAKQKYQLLLRGRVDAVLTVCGILEQRVVPDEYRFPEAVAVTYPAFFTSPVYLTFSRGFYQRHPSGTKQVIETVMQLDNQALNQTLAKEL